MKAILALFFVFGLAVCDDVIELTDADFDSVLEQHETALVMFYAPW